ncbi:MAG: fatty acid desaturase [Bacteriovorax sp.]|jgi:fatty acid desaturase
MEVTVETFKRQDVPAELLIGPSIRNLYFYTAVDWSVIVLCWYLLMNTTPYLYPLWIIIVAGRLHSFGVILHDVSHLNLANKTFHMRMLEILTGYVIGTSANAMAYHHIRHHRHTLKQNDPYFSINKRCIGVLRFWLTFKKGLFFVPFWITRSFVGVLAIFIPQLRTPYARIFLQDISGKDLSQDAEVITCAKEDIPVACFHSVLLYLALTKFQFLIYGYYYAIPVAGVFCIYRLLIEHEYNIVKDRSIYTMIESTFDHHLGFLERILIGPRNIGFHCIHHIHPQVGLHALPKLRKWYLENSLQYQQKYNAPKSWNWRQDLFGGIHHEENYSVPDKFFK